MMNLLKSSAPAVWKTDAGTQACLWTKIDPTESGSFPIFSQILAVGPGPILFLN